MTSREIRQSFLDFFKSKLHTIVPSSSLMPDSPNLLFTNAGMNQFVPIFLGQKKPDVSQWAGAIPGSDTRAADTQKCIRAGGKHNDLDDVGLDTYHHTFFEMLGNWSFGDYFKKEAIEWAWELMVRAWNFPPERLYATVFCPYLGEPGWEKKWAQELEQVLTLAMTSPDFIPPDPKASPFQVADQEAAMYWVKKFQSARLDPKIHLIPGNKKDNFWMMGETGPCGPCSELHVDLTPEDRTPEMERRGATLVNKGDARCIEIWNLVFIQFNANPDGTFSPLPAKHVDTGMGFERVTSIIQGTKGLKDFANAKISNYETDIFRPIFDTLEKLSGKKYGSTLPGVAQASRLFSDKEIHGQDARATTKSLLKTSGEAQSKILEVPLTEPHSGPASDEKAVPFDRKTEPTAEQIAVDVAFRVIADHIRTLSFAIADGIQPGNTDRNYVLRRILRRAVRYGRTLGFHEPFFYKLVDVLADTMGDVFPEIRAKKKHVQDVIRTEEEAFNKTLDRGIELFNEEVTRLHGAITGTSETNSSGGTGYQPVPAGNLPAGTPGATYSKRNLPHFEKPWAIYVVNFQTHNGRKLSPAARDIVFDCILKWRESRYRLIAACVMPDHVHMIIQPGIKEEDEKGEPVFWPLSNILHSIKSFSAKEINKLDKTSGVLWQDERFDRYVRSDRDLEEKFRYVCGNPWAAGIVDEKQPYRWLWTPEIEAAQPYVPPDSLPYAQGAGQVVRQNGPVARSTQTNVQISGAFAFKLYDTYGFPLDLTELMARERGLTVDVEGFNKLMDEQRNRARAAQKKEVVSVSQVKTTTPTKFVGYDNLTVKAKVLEVVSLKDKTAVILDTSACYAEMGGQVGDTGELKHGHLLWRVTNTQKSGNTWLHFISDAGTAEEIVNRKSQIVNVSEAPNAGLDVTLTVDKSRRNAIERHHTVTHLLHWALHEVVSKEASQKGSFVGPDKLTFDFNSAPLTPQQVADIEKLVNERILENAGVSWIEVPYAEVKSRQEVMQFFGEKYGDTVRVVQIGGRAQQLDGYSMELCGGTHTRATGEIGLFRIVSESAIAAGVRRIEAVAGLEAYKLATDQLRLLRSVAGQLNSPVAELEKKIESLLAQQKALEKQLKSAQQREASEKAQALIAEWESRTKDISLQPFPRNDCKSSGIVEFVDGASADLLQALVDSIKEHGFRGVVVLGSSAEGTVHLIAWVSPDLSAKIQANKIIQTIAPIVSGKGGGRPELARGSGKDPSRLKEALAKAREFIC